jgi:hypothetical protein
MARNSRKRRPQGRKSIMIWLFFLPFLLIGIALLALAATKVTQHLGAQAWQPVRAMLIERGVVNEKNANGSDRIGGAASISGAYTYEWQGKRYESRRLSFFSAKTRGMVPDDWDARLDAILGESGGSFDAWVNPRAPNEAVVLRDLRWFEIGVMVGVGLLLMWLSAAFLFGGDPHAATTGFSWRAVGVIWVVGSPLSALCPLLWRDEHSLWAGAAAVPLLLAMYGTLHGLLSDQP